MQRRLLSTLLVLLPGCFGVCGPGDQEFYAEAGCVAQAAPDSPEIQFGTAEGERFRRSNPVRRWRWTMGRKEANTCTSRCASSARWRETGCS